MKKVMSILLVAFMLIGSSTTVLAAENSLDIEKVAIQSIKNSQDIQSLNRKVDNFQTKFANVGSQVNQAKALLPYAGMLKLNAYSMVELIVLAPMEYKNALNQLTNIQEVATNGVRISAYKSYMDLLKAKSAMDIQQKLMLDLEADYQKAQKQQSLGEITSAQLRLSEITYLKAQNLYLGARHTYDSAMMAVNQAMGEDISKNYGTLQDNNIIPADQIKPLNEYVNTALVNRAEIINAQGALDTKQKEYEYHIAEIPTDYEFYKQKQEYIIASAQNDLDLAKITVQEDITNIYKLLEPAMKNWEAMKVLDEKADLDLKNAEVQYENGLISLQALGDVKVAKAQADVNFRNAQLDAWLAQTTMDSACGIGYNPRTLMSMETVNFSISPYASENNLNPSEGNDE